MLAIFSGDTTKAGPAGDMFGAITSLFTGLAFAGLIGTMIFQQRELKLQRNELKLQREEVSGTREEIKAQREQMELQNQQMQKQMFEETFFQMLKVFNDYIQDITGPISKDGTIPRKGRDELANLTPSMTYYSSDNQQEIATEYLNMYDGNTDDLGGYFRIIYNIIKYVHTSEIPNKKFYTNIVRAQLSESELVLLKYNLSTPLGEKFILYVNEYDLLKHCPEKYGGENRHGNVSQVGIVADHIKELFIEDA
ncbi:hypothetical protein F9L33_10175 [Amylibacter sp. SFDW26]|uniref:putative phage abortive infection protein n=1 Tax=Amylibacter sp. SFDW26 TaxID=2652722 RepID=UPI00126234DA|nr:putative phage abortive infection protein [Amylibacter sp. SFDW26]KAB7613731.1 hypothetical protein F9L33_10175 [Amylibacter sp. SFDW26]